MDRTPTEVFRERLRELREKRRYTREELARRLRALGFPGDGLGIARIETGRTKRVSIDELFALAYALDVSPLFLLLPYEHEEKFRVPQDDRLETAIHGELMTPYTGMVAPIEGSHSFGHRMLREWLRGQTPLPAIRDDVPGQDRARFYGELPPDELADKLEATKDVQIGRPSPPGVVDLLNAQVDAGEADPPPISPEYVEACDTVLQMTDEEVLAELGIIDFPEAIAEEAAKQGRIADELAAEAMEGLRGHAIQKFLAVARAREEMRQRRRRTDNRKKEHDA